LEVTSGYGKSGVELPVVDHGFGRPGTGLLFLRGEGEKTEAEKASPPEGRPNIILILADDLDKSVFERSTLDSQWTPFIEDQRSSSQPFYMYIAPLDTHEPLFVPPRHSEAYTEQQAPRPPSFGETDLSDKPAWVRDDPPLDKRRADQYDQLQVKRMRSALTLVDLSRNVLIALERTNQLHNTYIIFTSDNGYHMGLHRIKVVKGTPYVESHEVPFVVRGPGVPAGVSFDQLVANIDIASTVLDLAEVERPSWMDGRSFRSFLDGTAPSSWRTSLLIENMEGPGKRPRPPYYGVRARDEVYVEYASGEEEYYDLRADPYQLENRPQDAPQSMKEALAALKDCAGDGCRKADQPHTEAPS
jgi:N-acetylglucosamine-6-sulfatase